ncbi:hypothetical protein DSY0627 [Desulfitobacterium hafniense Y51]|uniref:Uncharacterized protein n=1 Tax=Desulfitobacterium hafniense (strain Y51) TaxID=138119 RepID=Q24ZX6_DESHY|nr:hypothetical protein DSY0627 [Desulfitobacterium hafniense Y51]
MRQIRKRKRNNNNIPFYKSFHASSSSGSSQSFANTFSLIWADKNFSCAALAFKKRAYLSISTRMGSGICSSSFSKTSRFSIILTPA